MYEHLEDSPVIQWGLQLLDGGPTNPGYYRQITHHSADDVCNGHYQEHYDTDGSHLENDEVIARTLQEEFLQMTVSEVSGYSHAGEEHYQASNLEHDWHSPSPMNHYYSGIQLSYCSDMCDSHQLAYIGYLDNFYYNVQTTIMARKKLMMRSLPLHILALVIERSILILWT